MKIHAFSKTYDGRQVLSFPDITLQGGQIYAVIGANGSGKSTLAKVTAGIIASDQKKAPTDAAQVGYMPQKNFAFRMSMRSNILLGGNNKEKAAVLMDRLHISHLADKRGNTLSGGETARMALARLMMKSYDLVILDEPTAAMDIETSLLSETLIREYVKETGCAMLIVTHNLQQAQRLADEVLFLEKGQLIECGAAKKVLSQPEKEETLNFLNFYGSHPPI